MASYDDDARSLWDDQASDSDNDELFQGAREDDQGEGFVDPESED